VAVAALRQLAVLGDTAAKHAAAIRPTRYDPRAVALFRSLSNAYTALHGRAYTVSNRKQGGHSSERASRPGGAAMQWTMKLLRSAAEATALEPFGPALAELVDHFSRNLDGLARRIKETRPKETKPKETKPGKTTDRRHLYRRAGSA
jgi:hypothetical protein